MNGSLRIDVVECHDLLIFKDKPRWDFAGNNLFKDGHRIVNSTCEGVSPRSIWARIYSTISFRNCEQLRLQVLVDCRNRTQGCRPCTLILEAPSPNAGCIRS